MSAPALLDLASCHQRCSFCSPATPPETILSKTLSSSIFGSALTMLPSLRSAAPRALGGMLESRLPKMRFESRSQIAARPLLTPCLPRTHPAALMSTSSNKSASALERQSQGGQLSASGKERKEVPLPSQEKAGNAMQYVLYESLG